MKYAFMNDRDIQLVKHINRHYQELLNEKDEVDTFESFAEGGIITKAIKMDILQIAENINCLSNESLSQLDPIDLKGIIGIRNRIVHGYITVDDEIIWKVIQNRLPKLIDDINAIK